MTVWIPAPYVDHREAWRSAYVHLFGVLSDDSELTTMLENLRRPVIKARGVNIRPRYAKGESAISKLAIKAKSVNIHKMRIVGVSATDILREKAAAEKKKALLVDPKRFADPVRLLFKESIFEIPQDRIDATRSILLRNLYGGQITGYYRKDGVKPIDNRDAWLEPGFYKCLASGFVSLPKVSAGSFPLWFNGSELAKAFPPKKTKPVFHLPQNVGRKSKVKPAAAAIAKIWPNGFENTGLTAEAGRIEVEKYIGDDIGIDSFRKARKLEKRERQVD